MNIKAIETAYKGYRFRSRLEARWAVFLDSFGEPWEYEKEGFELPSGRYLPDFWLPRLGCWLEIKGQEPTKDEVRKCEELGLETERAVALAWGLPFAARYFVGREFFWINRETSDIEWRNPCKPSDVPNIYQHVIDRKVYPSAVNTVDAERLMVFCFDWTSGSAGDNWWDKSFWAMDWSQRLCICSNNDHSDREFASPGNASSPFLGIKMLRDVENSIHDWHAESARAARFEFSR